MLNNKLKSKLYNGETAIGTFMAYSSPEMVEILGICGLDFVVLDCEHGPYSVESTTNLVRAAELRGITPITRVTCNNETKILRALDVGAHGVQVPQVNCKKDAQNVISSAKYHPIGKRGGAIPRAIEFGTIDVLKAYENANEQTLVVVHCETEECYNNLDEILSIPEIDVVFLGPFDMSQSLNIPQQFDHPKMIEITNTLLEKTKKAGKIPGIYVGTTEQAKLRIKQGFQYITIGMFETVVANTFKTIVDEMKK